MFIEWNYHFNLFFSFSETLFMPKQNIRQKLAKYLPHRKHYIFFSRNSFSCFNAMQGETVKQWNNVCLSTLLHSWKNLINTNQPSYKKLLNTYLSAIFCDDYIFSIAHWQWKQFFFESPFLLWPRTNWSQCKLWSQCSIQVKKYLKIAYNSL